MKFPKGLFNRLELCVGFCGLMGCVAVTVGVWIGGVRLISATEKLFSKVDDAFVAVRDRVSRTQTRVQESKITTGSIEQSLSSWAKEAARERLASRLNVNERSQRLRTALTEVDLWLELSATSTEMIQQILALGTLTAVPTNTELADRLLEEIGSLRGELAQALGLVDKISERTADDGAEAPVEKRIDEAAQIALRLLATFSSLDAQLANIQNQIFETQQAVGRWKTTTQRWILIAAIGVSLLMVWMGAGQLSLCWHARKDLRRSSTGGLTAGNP